MISEDATGHRCRLRSRYKAAGIEALADHEKLELLLTYALPRVDTKPIARVLLSRFKSVGAVLKSDCATLEEIDGIGEKAAILLRLAGDLTLHCLGEKISRGSVLSNRHDVENYLRMQLGSERLEYVVTLFLDNGNHIISHEVLAQGTINQCAIYPRLIIEKALRASAASIILCHNHPGGSLHASSADWEITRRLFDIGKLMEMPLLDHIIITNEQTISLRDSPRWPT